MLQLAWLLRAERLASALQVSPYSEAHLRSALPRLEALTTEPEEARHVARVLAECGTRFVVVEPIPGSKIEGVCFWINGGKSPAIALTLSRDRIDNFWFNLRHEIEHVLRGDDKNRPVLDEEKNDEDEAAIADEESGEERAANEAAANFCVPTKLMRDFIARVHPMYSNERLIGFSKIVRRHPGIVARQLQKQINRYNPFRGFQVKIRHIVVQTALTDGYGRPSPIVV